MRQYAQYGERLMAHFAPPAVDQIPAHITDYFDHDTGAYFEKMADTDLPNEITAADLVAVSMLGVTVPARVEIWLLNEGREKVSALLAQVPTDVDIWDAGDLIDEGKPLWNLWNLLHDGSWHETRKRNGMGMAKTSKLMATKRPRLVPLADSVVVASLPEVDDQWATLAEVLSDESLRRRITEATDGPGRELSLLRRIDLVIWTAHERKADSICAACNKKAMT